MRRGIRSLSGAQGTTQGLQGARRSQHERQLLIFSRPRAGGVFPATTRTRRLISAVALRFHSLLISAVRLPLHLVRASSAMHLPASPWLRALAGLSAALALACLYAAVSAPSASLLSAFVSAGGEGGGSEREDARNDVRADLGERDFDGAELGEGEMGEEGAGQAELGRADLFALAAETGREGEGGSGRERGGGKGEEDATLYPALDGRWALDGSSPVVALLAAHRRRMRQRVEEARAQAEQDEQRLHAAVTAAVRQLQVDRASLGDSFPLLDEAAASTIAALPPGSDSLAQIHAMLAAAPRVNVGEVDVGEGEGGSVVEGESTGAATGGVSENVGRAEKWAVGNREVGEAEVEEAVGEAVGECMDLYFVAEGHQTRFHIATQKQQQADREAELRQFMLGQLRALDDRREWWVALNLTGEEASEKLKTMPDGAGTCDAPGGTEQKTKLSEFLFCDLLFHTCFDSSVPLLPATLSPTPFLCLPQRRPGYRSSFSGICPSNPQPSPHPPCLPPEKTKLSEFLFWYLPFQAWFDSEGPDHPKAVAHVEEQRAVLAAATSAATSAKSTLKATQDLLWEECGLRLPHSNWTDEQSALLERYAAVANVSGCTEQCTDWEAIYPEYETQPGLVAPKHVWQKLPEHYPDTRPNISFIVTYSGRAERVLVLVSRLYACTHGMAGTGSLPGIRAEMLVSVMHPDETLEAWMQARNDTAEGIFVVPVLPRLGAAPMMLNDLARMARGEVVLMLHGDALPPASCLWLDRMLAAFASWPRLAVAGFRTDGLGEAGSAGEAVGGEEVPQMAPAAASLRYWRGFAEEMAGRGTASGGGSGDAERLEGGEGGEVGWRDPETGVAMHFTGLVTAFPLVVRRSVLEDMGWLDEADLRQGEAAVMSDWHLCCRTWLSGYQVARLQLHTGDGDHGDWLTVTRARHRHVLPGRGAFGGEEQGGAVEYGEYDAAMAGYHDDIVKEVARLNGLLVRNRVNGGETRSYEPLPDDGGGGGAKRSPPHTDSSRETSYISVDAIDTANSAAASDAPAATRGHGASGGSAGGAVEEARGARDEQAQTAEAGRAVADGIPAEGMAGEGGAEGNVGMQSAAQGTRGNGEVAGEEAGSAGADGAAEGVGRLAADEGEATGRGEAEGSGKEERKGESSGKEQNAGGQVARSVERHQRAQQAAGAPRGEGQAGGGNGAAGILSPQHGHAPHHAFTDSAPLHAPLHAPPHAPLHAPLHHPLHAPLSPLRAGGRLQQLQAEEWGGGEGGMGRDVSTNSNMGAAEWLEGCLEEEEEWQQWRIDPQQLVIKSFLARGTYGSVHRGEYRGKQVAVKLMDWGEVDKASRAKLTFLRDVFAQEVLVWSTLQHKNICQFVGALLGGPDTYTFPSTVEDHRGVLRVGSHVCCVVLEFLAGGTLKQLLMKHYHKKLSVHRVVHLALDIAEGLEYLHSRGIVHRDVKSDNMLLDKHHRVVKIADFGVSRVKSDNGTMHHKTGTYGYMAPEVLKERPYDHKADVYSYGILLWEIYCCDNPFPYHDLDSNEIASTVNQGLRPDIPSCCPPQLAELMRRCWHQDAGKRPDMSEVVRRLKAIDCRHATPMRPVEGDDSSCSLM
ncbi:unnamed protein product [Closterium sp. Yama58-4]|nr:unnamed protein product [Closterium sp. Yama58-4]